MIQPDDVDMSKQPIFFILGADPGVSSRAKTLVCHPERRPGIQSAVLPFSIIAGTRWIPDQVRDDKFKTSPDDRRIVGHPGRRPGIQSALLPFAIVAGTRWIPDQVRDDRFEESPG
jgi:hypothetical protein